MNDWKPWEQHLSGWTPRHPSPRIKRRLFATGPVAEAETVWPLHWNRMAATAAFVLAAILLGTAAYHDPVGASASRYSSLRASLSLSNQHLASYYSPHRHSRQNAWSVLRPAGTFEWTNAARSLSTTGSFPIWKTNSLIQ